MKGDGGAQARRVGGDPGARVVHLFEVPEQVDAAARLIHEEFWSTVSGASVQTMARRLRQAAVADRLPLCRVASVGGELVGVVNLVDNDDEQHPHWHPWLAGLVVKNKWRGQGHGSGLVRQLLADARALGVPQVYLGTDGPDFYRRLGAQAHERAQGDFWFMRFDLC